GSLYDIDHDYSTNPITRNYLSLWFDHGTNPVNATYSYVVLPGMSSNEVAAYAAQPRVTILENSTAAQAARETNLNMTAVNFWNIGSKTVDFLTASGPASVIARETAGGLWLGISDPTQTNSRSTTVTVSRAAVALISADSGVTVNRLSPTIELSVSMSGRRGQTAHSVFAYTTNTPPTVSIIAPAEGSTVTTNRVAITADAFDPDAGQTIARVEFYAGTGMIGESTNVPYTIAWTNVNPGNYTLTAKAVDSTGRLA